MRRTLIHKSMCTETNNMRALDVQAESLMAVDSVGKVEHDRTAWLLEAVDRVLLSVDEVPSCTFRAKRRLPSLW